MDESCSSKDIKEPKKVITYDINNIGGNSGYIGQNFDKRREFYIKETDSPYIRKAKQGGTKDLLSFDADIKTSHMNSKFVDNRPGDHFNSAVSMSDLKHAETDYIKLAKQGGLKNLLSLNCEPVNETEAKLRQEFRKKSKNPDHQHRPSPFLTEFNEMSEWTVKMPRTGLKPIKGMDYSRFYPPQSNLSASEERKQNKSRDTQRQSPFLTDDLSFWQRKPEVEVKLTLEDRLRGRKK